MEQTYLCKFDIDGRRTETLLSCEFTEEEKAEKLEQGYIEISQEDWEYYVGNKGNGKNGTGYIRGKDGKPTDAPVHVPTKDEQLAQLDSQYDSDKAELTKYFTDALLADDTDTQEELKAELLEIDADYKTQRKEIEEGDE
jgi:hypothetical protein